ncbi:hypothetical protein ABZW49_28580 [Nonomuraea wenchangensis]
MIEEILPATVVTFDARFTGDWVAAGGLVLTAIAMTAPPDARKAA